MNALGLIEWAALATIASTGFTVLIYFNSRRGNKKHTSHPKDFDVQSQLASKRLGRFKHDDVQLWLQQNAGLVIDWHEDMPKERKVCAVCRICGLQELKKITEWEFSGEFDVNSECSDCIGLSDVKFWDATTETYVHHRHYDKKLGRGILKKYERETDRTINQEIPYDPSVLTLRQLYRASTSNQPDAPQKVKGASTNDPSGYAGPVKHTPRLKTLRRK